MHDYPLARSKVLVVEESGNIQRLLERRLPSESVSVSACSMIGRAGRSLKTGEYDVLVWDVGVSPAEQSKGIEVLHLLSRLSCKTFVVVIADPESESLSQNHFRANAHRALTRPVSDDQIFETISTALRQQPPPPKAELQQELIAPLELEGMLGISLPMQEVFKRVLEAASEDISVLITGETGTGKDMVASAIHKRSRRRNGPYVAVNTGAIPRELIASELFGHERGAFTGAMESYKGHFEEAHGGTIFLDEISTIDDKAQVSLLRVLETKTFRRVGGSKDICADVRIVAATNENLEEAVRQKKFREDLYYRLDVFHIHVPALRERPPGAVALLTNHFVPHFNVIYKKSVRTIAPETWRMLRSYSWPGNVRELKNVIQRAVLMATGNDLTPDLLPLRIRNAANLETNDTSQTLAIHAGMTLNAVERELIRMTLASTQGNKKEAAQKLAISRRTLYDKLKKHRLS
jgi:DNA-binding NtrC family response regulator